MWMPTSRPSDFVGGIPLPMSKIRIDFNRLSFLGKKSSETGSTKLLSRLKWIYNFLSSACSFLYLMFEYSEMKFDLCFNRLIYLRWYQTMEFEGAC